MHKLLRDELAELSSLPDLLFNGRNHDEHFCADMEVSTSQFVVREAKNQRS
jgi:hypothetical protein